MRYRRILSKEQIEYLLAHASVCNKDLAHKLNTRACIISSYKSRARKQGYKIPFSNEPYNKIDEEIKAIANNIKKAK